MGSLISNSYRNHKASGPILCGPILSSSNHIFYEWACNGPWAHFQMMRLSIEFWLSLCVSYWLGMVPQAWAYAISCYHDIILFSLFANYNFFPSKYKTNHGFAKRSIHLMTCSICLLFYLVFISFKENGKVVKFKSIIKDIMLNKRTTHPLVLSIRGRLAGG